MTQGIKISKLGVDVKTAADADLAFSSTHKHLKVYSSGKIVGTSQTVAHPFGYPISFAGYALSGGKYSVRFDYNVDGYEFEVTDYGKISTDNDNIYLSADVAGGLVYIAFADKADPSFDPVSVVRAGTMGIEVSEEGQDLAGLPDGKLSFTSEYLIPNIVQSGVATVTTPAVSPQGSIYENSTTTDVTHTLGYAAHLILLIPYEGIGLQYYPAPSGVAPGEIHFFTEVYIDSSKIRFRVSKLYYGLDPIFTQDDPAADFDFRYYLTNYRLPT